MQAEATPIETKGIEEMFRISFSEQDLKDLRDTLKDMKNPVEVYTFIDGDCPYCEKTVELMNIIAEASPEIDGGRMIKHIVVDRSRDGDSLFQRFRVERVPTVAMVEGYVRYTGMPAGEEVRGLVETIIRISQGESDLSPSTVEKVAALKGDVHIEVVVTPTCPYCPYAALLANMLAYESFRNGNKVVLADTVEAYENPDIADSYGVLSVPTIAINGSVEFVGLPYEAQLLEKVVEHSEKVWRKKRKKEELMKLLDEFE